MIRSLLIALAMLAMGAAPALAVMFDHAEHLLILEGEACATCHMDPEEDTVVFNGPASIVPEREVCLNCHEEEFMDEVEFPALKTHGPVWTLNHRPFAKGNAYDCFACHQQVDCLECHQSGFADEMGDFGNNMINVHRSDFHVTHPIAARTDPQLCASCHENRFCVDCHDNFAPADLRVQSHRQGFTFGTFGGAHASFSPEQCVQCHNDPETGQTVLPTHEWTNQHAREARRDLASCQACHPEGDICLQCHSARTGLMVNPHPSDWDDIKGRLERASDGKTCRKCH